MLSDSVLYLSKDQKGFPGTQANQVVTDLEETPQKTETETFWSISLKYMAVAIYFLMILIWDKRLQSSILDFLGLLPWNSLKPIKLNKTGIPRFRWQCQRIVCSRSGCGVRVGAAKPRNKMPRPSTCAARRCERSFRCKFPVRCGLFRMLLFVGGDDEGSLLGNRDAAFCNIDL